jgi:hypothetical protein
MLNTVDLLVQSSLILLHLVMITIYLFTKKHYLGATYMTFFLPKIRPVNLLKGNNNLGLECKQNCRYTVIVCHYCNCRRYTAPNLTCQH